MIEVSRVILVGVVNIWNKGGTEYRPSKGLCCCAWIWCLLGVVCRKIESAHGVASHIHTCKGGVVCISYVRERTLRRR